MAKIVLEEGNLNLFFSAVLFLGLLAVGGWVALYLRRRIVNHTLRRRFAVGAKAETDALALLKHHGYSVLKGQARAQSHFTVDGKNLSCDVRADYLAEKGGDLYVVEVKSGETAPDPKYTATRRQLLEYEHVFQPKGLLLADMNKHILHHVSFGLQELKAHKKPSWINMAVAAMIGLFLGLFL
jgi:hypothetical protein